MDGLEFKIARLRAGLRAYEVARRVGLSESALSRIETGRRQASPEEAARIAEALSATAAGSSPDHRPAA